MPTKKPDRDVDETFNGTDRTDGATPGAAAAAAAADKDTPQQVVEERTAWGALISAQAQHPSLSLLGGGACIWQDPLTGSLALAPGSARSQQLCRLEVQKPGPTGGQPLAVLSALASHALQLDGKTLAAGERVPLHSGSELIVLPSFSAASSLPERRGCALFLFMPADLAAYDERAGAATAAAAAGAAGPPSAAGPSGDATVAGAVPTAATATAGANPGGGAAADTMRRFQRAALLESLLQRASLGAGRAVAAPEDAYYAAVAGQPARRLQGQAAAGMPSPHRQYQQQPQQSQSQRQVQAQGAGAEGWASPTQLSGMPPYLSGMPPYLLRALLRTAPPGAAQRWQLTAAAAEQLPSARTGDSFEPPREPGQVAVPRLLPDDANLMRHRPAATSGRQRAVVAPSLAATEAFAPPGFVEDGAADADPAVQRLKRLRAVMAAAAGLGSAAPLPPRPFSPPPPQQQQQPHHNNPRRGQQATGGAAAAPGATGTRDDGAAVNWGELARLGRSITAAAAAAAAAATPAPEPRPHPQRHQGQRRQPGTHTEAAEAELADLDSQWDELLLGLFGQAEGCGTANDELGGGAAAATSAAAAAPGSAQLRDPAAPLASRAFSKVPTQAGGAPAGRGGGKGRALRLAACLAKLMAAERAGAGADSGAPAPAAASTATPAAAAAPGALPDESLSDLSRRLQDMRAQAPLPGSMFAAGLSASAPVSPCGPRTAEDMRGQARSAGGQRQQRDLGQYGSGSGGVPPVMQAAANRLRQAEAAAAAAAAAGHAGCQPPLPPAPPALSPSPPPLPPAGGRPGGGASSAGSITALQAMLQEALEGLLPPEALLPPDAAAFQAAGVAAAAAPPPPSGRMPGAGTAAVASSGLQRSTRDENVRGEAGAARETPAAAKGGSPPFAAACPRSPSPPAAAAAATPGLASPAAAVVPLPGSGGSPAPSRPPSQLPSCAVPALPLQVPSVPPPPSAVAAAAGVGALAPPARISVAASGGGAAAAAPASVPVASGADAGVQAAAPEGDGGRAGGGGGGGDVPGGGLPAGLAPDSDALVTDFLAGLICGALEEEAAGTAAAVGAPGGGSSGGGDTAADAVVATSDGAAADVSAGVGLGGAKDAGAVQYDAAVAMAIDEVPGGTAAAAEAAEPLAEAAAGEEGLDAVMEAQAAATAVVPPGPSAREGEEREEENTISAGDVTMGAIPGAEVEAEEAMPDAQAGAPLPQEAAAPQAPAPGRPRHPAQAPPPQAGPAQPLSDPVRKRVAAFKAELAASALTRPEALTITFDNLPYYLGSGTKDRLMATATLHLRHSRFATFTADLAPMSPRLLLSGPFGSDIYQQAVVSALAAACGATLLVLDRLALGLEGDGALGGPGGAPGAAGGGAGLGDAGDDGRDADLDLDDDDDSSLDLGLDPSRFASRWQPSGLKRRRLLGFFGGAAAAAAAPGGDKPPPGGGASGDKAAGGGGAAPGAAARGGAAGSDKGGPGGGPRHLRKGDRVRFWGAGGGGAGGGGGLGGVSGLPGSLSSALLGGLPGGGGPMSYLVSAMGHRAAARAAGEAAGLPGGGVGPSSASTSSGGAGGARGPAPGSAGRVVLAFDDNPRKVGVRFDSPVPGGLDLGGACEEGHGFFCAASELVVEGSRSDEEAEGAAVAALFELAAELAAAGPVVVHIRDAERVVVGNLERFNRVRRALDSLPAGVLVVASHAPRSGGAGRGLGGGLGGGWGAGGGSRLPGVVEPMLLLDPMFGRLADKVRGLSGSDDPRDSRSVRALLKAFPNRVTLHAPHGEPAASEWRAALERDVGTLRERANRRALAGLMARCGVECADLGLVVIRDQALSAEAVERVVGWAVASAVQRAASSTTTATTASGAAKAAPSGASATPADTAAAAATAAASPAAATATPGPTSVTPGPAADEEILLRGGQLQVTAADVASAVATLKAVAAERVPPSKQGLQDVQVEGEFEKKLLAEVVPPEELGVSFDSIGALEAVKETLREVVMLPLQRPELFTRGTLTKPTKGVLLFGPPGTGKTMLAKAVASECGANFLYVSLSSVTSKWFGEAEKYIKAVFTLAHKIAPSVIFVDEVDSLLGKRTGSSSEHEASRKMKNEFMAHWDGLKTRQKDRVMVLAATNRPMDLDEAVIRRMPRRIMVDLPDAGNRVKILKVLLKDEDLDPGFPMEELAALTEGYSGSDLKNMCVAAAYRPIRELIAAERAAAAAEKARLEAAAYATGAADACDGGEGRRGAGAGVSSAAAAAAAAREPSPVLPVASASRGVTPEVGPPLRALTLEDFKAAMQQVGPSVAGDHQGSLMSELRRWNEAYGEGGKRKADMLTYFL